MYFLKRLDLWWSLLVFLQRWYLKVNGEKSFLCRFILRDIIYFLWEEIDGPKRRNLLLIFFNIKSEPVFVVVVLWRGVVKNEKAMGAILFHPWDPLCGAWGAEKEVRASPQTLSRLFSFFGGLENIARIANAVQVTLRQSVTNPQRHDYIFSNGQELGTVYLWNCI